MQQHDDGNDAFGFGSVKSRAKDRIKQIRPSAPPDAPVDFTRVDEIAGSAGFVSRESTPVAEASTKRGRPRGPEAFEALNMRAPSSLAAAFRSWCTENRYSYPSGLAEIMRRAGISTRVD